MASTSQSQINQCTLRPLALVHIPIISKWCECIDDLILFDRQTPLPISAEAMEIRWRDSILGTEPRTSNWFIIDAGDESLVGLAGLQDINYMHGDAVLAILIERSSRRKGIGIRTGAILLDIGFNQLRLRRVSTFVRADNQGSRNLTKGLGFQVEGCVRQGWYANGVHTDILTIGILADEWQNRRKTLQKELNTDTRVALGNGLSDSWTWPQIPAQARPARIR